MSEHFRTWALTILVVAGIGSSAGLASDANAAVEKTPVIKTWKPPVGTFTGDPDIGSNKTPPPPGAVVRHSEGDQFPSLLPKVGWLWWWEVRAKFLRGGW